jgi:hypothetical protein
MRHSAVMETTHRLLRIIILLLVGIPLIAYTPTLTRKISDAYVFTQDDARMYDEAVNENRAIMLLNQERYERALDSITQRVEEYLNRTKR